MLLLLPVGNKKHKHMGENHRLCLPRTDAGKDEGTFFRYFAESFFFVFFFACFL